MSRVAAKKNESLLIGRDAESEAIRACLQAGKNVLLEGPVGVGKTHLAVTIAEALGRPVFRVDGDNRYTEQKLSGWFDPPTVIKKGYGKDAFVPGPLIEAMQAGGVLFINELNRLPEGVQNVLLPAIDEKLIVVPKLGIQRAKSGFVVVATQNPKEFVATSHLSEAILDRFELVLLDYQSEQEETKIVQSKLGASIRGAEQLARAAVRLTRITRDHPRVKRGASVRAALSIAEIATVFMAAGKSFKDAFLQAVLLALPTRIELERDADGDVATGLDQLLREWAEQVLTQLDGPVREVKKKT